MKALVLFSGGLDSSTLLAMAVEEHGRENVLALSLDYGQKHDKELACARSLAEHYGAEQLFLDLSGIFAQGNSSLLSHSTQEIPKGSYGDLQNEGGAPISTYVPFRNGLFLSAASSVALGRGCELVYYAAHRDDWAGSAYPDCSVSFVEVMVKAISEGTGGQLHVTAPFINWNKAQIVTLGLSMHVPYELTWSCYEGREKPCGLCATCVDRARAFAENREEDPLLRRGAKR